MSNSILSPKTFLTYSLGCRTNQVEMENISLQLIARGYTPLTPALLLLHSPALIILNTCVVTAKAERETRKEIHKLRRLYPKSFLVVLGCAVTAQQKFKISLPEADLFISNSKKKQALKIILNKITSPPPLKHFNFTHDRELFYNVSEFNKYQFSGRKFIKIQDGCGCNCSFCITTLLRGQPVSASCNKIVEEIKFWVHKGINEVILTGINLALYGMDINTNITTLLKTILKKTTIKKISFSSIYPEILTKDLLDLVIKNPRIARCFHLSLQSGSPFVLKRMNRKTDLDKLSQAIRYLRKHIPEFTIRTDIITGFPNETDKEFEQTLNLLKQLNISFVHVFPFSKRIGTVAYQKITSGAWKDLPEKTKSDRVKIIAATVQKVREGEAKKIIGITQNCLIVRLLNRSWEGITENGWPIIVKSSKFKFQSLKGKILPVKITDFKNDQLFGEILSLPI